MAFCVKCGAKLEEGSRFCPQCGAPAQQADQARQEAQPRTTVQGENKLMGVLSYLGILVVIPLLAARDDPFVLGHARQGLWLLIGEVAVSILSGIPLFGYFVQLVGGLGCLVLAIMGIVAAAQGERRQIPIIGELAEKYPIIQAE